MDHSVSLFESSSHKTKRFGRRFSRTELEKSSSCTIVFKYIYIYIYIYYLVTFSLFSFRYNISTDDYDGWGIDAKSNGKEMYDQYE